MGGVSNRLNPDPPVAARDSSQATTSTKLPNFDLGRKDQSLALLPDRDGRDRVVWIGFDILGFKFEWWLDQLFIVPMHHFPNTVEARCPPNGLLFG